MEINSFSFYDAERRIKWKELHPLKIISGRAESAPHRLSLSLCHLAPIVETSAFST